MLSLERFERLLDTPLATKEMSLSFVGQNLEHLPNWIATLPLLEKSEQHRQLRLVLGELIIVKMDDHLRFKALQSLSQLSDRIVQEVHSAYIHNPQKQNPEQKTYIEEVRGFYFLLILGFVGIAQRLYEALKEDNQTLFEPTKKTNWLQKLTGGLSGNVVRNGNNISILDKDKTNFTLSVWHIMALSYKLLFEFAITYQKAPKRLWKLMNEWYLKAAVLGVDRLDIAKLSSLKSCTINHQYAQCCAVSFANLFAYRRADIIHIFRIFPEWSKLAKSSFIAEKSHRIFVDLQSSNPPEVINSQASINPYSSDVMCLFFDTSELFAYLKSLDQQEPSTSNKHPFEIRLAKILLLAFDREAESTFVASKVHNRYIDTLMGFGPIFKEIANGRNFSEIINQDNLASAHQPLRLFELPATQAHEQAKLVRSNEISAKFVLSKTSLSQTRTDDIETLTRPFLSVFSLFALKLPQLSNRDPWKLGIIHWVQDSDEGVEIEGKFLGRILSVCGVRLSGHDMRSKDFVQALLVAGDGLNKQTTLILPRYHFKAGDPVILRMGDKQTTLRLEQNLLTTDDIEQYKIVRLR